MATPAVVNKPTVTAVVHFDPAEDCKRLHKAMAGLGTNEKAIIEILSKRSAEQRQILIKTFDTDFKNPLLKTLQKELRGGFEKLVLALMELPAVADAKRVGKATKGLGTNEAALVDVICSKDNFQMDKLKAAYQLVFEKSLIEDVRRDTSGDFQKVILTLLRCERDDSDKVDEEEAEIEAQALFKAGEGKRGTDKNVFTEVLCKRNYKQLRLIFDKYENIAGHEFERAVKSEISGHLQKAYSTIVEITRGVHEYYATKIEGSMKGMGTKEDALIRYIVQRLEIDMGNIKLKYHEMYNKSLEQAISKESSGNFRTMLLELIS